MAKTAGNCTMSCDTASTCTATLDGVHDANLTCSAGATCDFTCTNLHDCNVTCEAGASCTVHCDPNDHACHFQSCASTMKSCPGGVIVCNATGACL